MIRSITLVQLSGTLKRGPLVIRLSSRLRRAVTPHKNREQEEIVATRRQVDVLVPQALTRAGPGGTAASRRAAGLGGDVVGLDASPSHGRIDRETRGFGRLIAVDGAEVDHAGDVHRCREAAQVEGAELVPLGQEHQRGSAVGSGMGIVQPVDAGQQRLCTSRTSASHRRIGMTRSGRKLWRCRMGSRKETDMSQERQTRVVLDPADLPDAPHLLPSARLFGEAFDISKNKMIEARLDELVNLLCIPKDADQAQKNAQIMRAVELYEGLAPTDAAEGMLAMQMVGTHLAALKCLRIFAKPEHTIDSLNLSLKYAHKLMSLFVQQLAALDKHRGKGQQKVTVEHVHVEAGGNAIVGNVEAAARPRKTKAVAALSKGAEMPFELPTALDRASKS